MFYNGIIVNNITDFCSKLSQEPYQKPLQTENMF